MKYNPAQTSKPNFKFSTKTVNVHSLTPEEIEAMVE